MTNFILPAFEGKKGEQSPEIYYMLGPSDLSYPNLLMGWYITHQSPLEPP